LKKHKIIHVIVIIYTCAAVQIILFFGVDRFPLLLFVFPLLTTVITSLSLWLIQLRTKIYGIKQSNEINLAGNYQIIRLTCVVFLSSLTTSCVIYVFQTFSSPILM
jgi:hypothetical protein